MPPPEGTLSGMRTASRALLSSDEAVAVAARLPAWRFTTDGRALERLVDCGTFAEAIAFVGRVALLAEAVGHAPELDVRGPIVRVSLSTRAAGGVTALDADLADWIERVAP